MMTARSPLPLILSAIVLAASAALDGAAAGVRGTPPAPCQDRAATIAPASASSSPAGASTALPTPEQVAYLRARGLDLIGQGDIAGARLALTRASSAGDACALFTLAETYDPTSFTAWGVVGMRSDAGRAVALYGEALRAGIAEAQARLDRLR